MENLREQIDGWELFCQRSYAATSVKMYKCVIEQLYRHIERNGQIFNAASIEDFLDSKYRNGGSKRLFNTYRIVVMSFCNWRQRKFNVESPAKNIPKIKEGRSSPRVLSQEEFKFIVDFVKSPMDKDILLFLANTGLRRSEFANLRWNDFSADLKYVRVIGKGDKTRVIPLNNTCKEILQKYPRLPDQPLQLAMRYPGPENCSWLCRRISRKNPAMKPFGSHSLRHYFATQLIRNNVSLFKVSKILGHSSVKITESCYIHLTPVDLLGITDVLD